MIPHAHAPSALLLLVCALAGGAEEAAVRPPPTTAAHPADGAVIVALGAVAPDILALELQSGEYRPGALVRYAAQPGDRIIPGKEALVVRDGVPVQAPVGDQLERRDVAGHAEVLGVLTPDRAWLMQPDRVVGTPLDQGPLEDPAAYAIASADDPAYAAPQLPVAVWRKNKPDSPLGAAGELAIRFHVYLHLPQALHEGATYEVRLPGLNTRAATATYRHDTRRARSDAIHITGLGYRPDDPFKRGYCSLWLGTGGGYAYAGLDRFEVIDAASGATVFTGTPALAKAKDAPDGTHGHQDSSATAVYHLDFTGFTTPGSYRLRLPGIGTSHPFTIAAGVWEQAFRTGMHGILCQRSGIALEPAFTGGYHRPRAYHPDDGVKFYQTDLTIAGGQEGARGEALQRWYKEHGSLQEVTGVWGGYQDAGDWDTYATTLRTADQLTELYDVCPEYFRRLRLPLPPAEAGDAIPDLLDEALWGLAAFRRLQLPDGSVRDGYGDADGCRPGDLSWNDSNPVCVYAASAGTSFLYASVAARMARLLAPFDKTQAADYRASAVRAWTWAEAATLREDAAKPPGDAERRDPRWQAGRGGEAAAAVALYWLTGDKAYEARFRALSELQSPKGTDYDGGWIEPLQQADATFLYARLPDSLADPALKDAARRRFILAGNVAVHYQQGNSLDLATVNSGMPMFDFVPYFTNPGMGPDIVRAHALTGDPRYLAVIVASTGFGLGANPENRGFTTGLGPNPIRFPLKLDSRRSGQEAPAGITVFGPSNQGDPRASGSSGWVHQWILQPQRMTPASRTWPPTEAYCDVFGWPACNEFCVNTPMTSTACVWGYLAARGPR